MLEKFLIFFGLKQSPEPRKKIVKRTAKQCDAQEKFKQQSVQLQLTIEQRNKLRNELKKIPASIRSPKSENN